MVSAPAEPMMSRDDQRKWNAKYAACPHAWIEPSRVVTSLAKFLPEQGRAIDVAGGAGRHAVWLAERGLEVCLADISTTGLTQARARAKTRGVQLQSIEVDLERDSFPAGPWDVILSHHFLWRPLFQAFPESLTLGGVLIVVQPTVLNLQRHTKPPREFLLESAELRRLVAELDVLHYQEDWLDEGRHEAALVARRRI